MFTACDADTCPQLFVIVTLYIVDVDGAAVIVCVVSPVDHTYLVPVLAVNTTEPPGQTSVGPPAVINAEPTPFAVTTTES